MSDGREQPTSAMVSSRGIKTSKDFVDFFGALMDDLVSSRIDAETAKAACGAGEVMLKAVKMQREYSASEALTLSPAPKLKQLPKSEEEGK
ncbi:MAG TPA: hypothetical protein VN666_21685 [Nitrospira sp.]|nr:hypothetical protein [Nitrospira sp.]